MTQFQHPGCVLQDWVFGLPYMQQSVLLTAVRGCDQVPKEDPSKKVTRGVRRAFMKSARPNWPKRTFLGEGDGEEKFYVAIKQFLSNLDHYPHHFLMHLAHAAQILGYKHPEEDVREMWNRFYLKFCDSLHTFPETCEDMDRRLSDMK